MAFGCIPVYWPATADIENEIPKNMFIDVREYSSIAELFRHLDNICASEIEQRREDIREFYSKKYAEVSIDRYVEKALKIVRAVIEDQ